MAWQCGAVERLKTHLLRSHTTDISACWDGLSWSAVTISSWRLLFSTGHAVRRTRSCLERPRLLHSTTCFLNTGPLQARASGAHGGLLLSAV